MNTDEDFTRQNNSESDAAIVRVSNVGDCEGFLRGRSIWNLVLET